MEIYELVTTDFDGMENHNPYRHGSQYFDNLESVSTWLNATRNGRRFYIGYDGQAYPQYSISRHIVLNKEDIKKTFPEYEDIPKLSDTLSKTETRLNC